MISGFNYALLLMGMSLAVPNSLELADGHTFDAYPGHGTKLQLEETTFSYQERLLS